MYTSYRRHTALSEVTQLVEDEDPLEPMLLLSISVESSRIVDLTSPVLHRRLGVRRAELDASIIDKSADASVPQRLGHLAYGIDRIEGLQVWSRVERREKNLVLFVDRLGMRYMLHDPSRVVASDHPAITEALERLLTS